MAVSASLASFYSDLSRFGQSGEYDRALRSAEKILREVPDDGKVFHCKIVSMIQLSQFEEALKSMNSHSQLSSELIFEKGYCLYRLNRVKEALQLLRTVPNPSFQVQELLAQVLYRLEDYENCYDTYCSLIKNSVDDYEDERETNLSAVLASFGAETGKEFKNAPNLREHTYELSYNKACILLGRKEYAQAINKLKTAEELCRKTLEEEDTPEDEIEEELGIIRTQHGFALQMQQRNEEALKNYNLVLKQKPSDAAVVAVASNNIVTINKDQNVFESKKRVKAATSDGLEAKLNSSQRCSIAINHALFLLNINQWEACKKQLEVIKKEYPNVSAQVALIQAATLCREKKFKDAVQLLKNVSASNPDQSLNISFTLVQLLLSQGHISQATDILKSLGDISYQPGVVSAILTLYLNLEDFESASKILNESIDYYKKHQSKSSFLSCLVRESAKFNLRYGNAKDAARLLEEQRMSNMNDTTILAQLISAYSVLDPQKARELSKGLPSVEELASEIDVLSLESSSWTMGVKYIRKKGEGSPISSPQADLINKKKKKKRKSGKMPKNYDPNVDPDPERWLPKRERSSFKKRKDRRTAAVGKGTQGTIGGTTELDITKGSLPSPRPGVTNPSPGEQGPRQQRPQPLKNKKKKKTTGRW